MNHLWQDDEPYQNAVDTVASVRRYLPTYRSHTSTAQAYLRNWGRTRTVRQALPLSLSALLGIVGHAALYEDWATAAACYIGYLCLLRTGEILTLKVQHVVHYEESHKSVLCLPDSKGANRKDVSEFVLVHDPVARQLLRIMMAGKRSDDSVFGLTWASLARGLRASAAAVGINDAGLSGYSLRRGGATFHFTQFASLDATTSYGRWQLAGTARKYVSQAIADLEEVRLCASGSTRASRLARVFQLLVAYKLQQCSAENKQDF